MTSSSLTRRVSRAGHGEAAGGHHDDAHHHGPHPTFTPPYNKVVVGAIVFGVVGALGVGYVYFSCHSFILLVQIISFIISIPIMAVSFQNRKHGYTK
jgi:hypothetical protein